jgi:hypothetical protein
MPPDESKYQYHCEGRTPNTIIVQQKLSTTYAELIATTSWFLISTHILDSFRQQQSFCQYVMGIDIYPQDEPSYTIKYPDVFLQYVEGECCANTNQCPSLNSKTFQAAICGSLQWLLDLVNLLLICMICLAIIKNIERLQAQLK